MFLLKCPYLKWWTHRKLNMVLSRCHISMENEAKNNWGREANVYEQLNIVFHVFGQAPFQASFILVYDRVQCQLEENYSGLCFVVVLQEKYHIKFSFFSKTKILYSQWYKMRKVDKPHISTAGKHSIFGVFACLMTNKSINHLNISPQSTTN